WFSQKYQAIYFTCITVDTFEEAYQSVKDEQFFETLIHLLLTTIRYNNNQPPKEFNQIILEVKAKWIATNKFNYSLKNSEKSNQKTDTESRLEILYSESLSTNSSPTETPLVLTSQNSPLNKQNKDTESLNFEEAYFNTINQRRNISQRKRSEGNYPHITHIKNKPTVEEQTNMYIPNDSHRMVEDRRAPVDFTNMRQHQAQNQQQTPPPEFDNQQVLQTLLRGINKMFESNATRAAIATTNPKEYKLIDFHIFLGDNDEDPIE
ncbi:13143_t:CDS:2, partial [Dentiscutata erythropus]